MNSILVRRYSPLLALLLLFISACICFETPPPAPATPPPAPPQALIKKASDCPMGWVLPGTAGYVGVLPAFGETPFEWTEHPEAGSYELLVTQPDGVKVPYKSEDTSKSLFMENFKQTGEYLVELTAFDSQGQPLCSITLTFTKDVGDPKADSSDGDPGAAPLPVIEIPAEPEVPR